MADVFKGRIQGPAGFERVFVVKRILPHLSGDPTFIRMFVDEAKLSARLNHPNIVQIFELGSVEDEYFISMEYVPGHDLAETTRALWKNSGPPRVEMVAYVGREICRALSYAHGLTDEQGQALGMIHRDVSPSNVMLSYEGAVKLLDFGIAKALGDSPETTKSETLKGKYAYMAPEQTEGEDVDHRIDIFAAGIVLYEVLTGRRLFKGANDLQTIERVRRCEVRPPSQANPACPPEMDAILLKALSRDRDDRYQDASEMADALDEIVHAARFTAPRLSAILRETFGADISSTGSFSADRRPAASSSTSRSATIPPVSVSQPRSTGQFAANTSQSFAATATAVTPRPVWKRGSFWALAVVCAVGVGVGVTKGVLPGGLSAVTTTTRPDPAPVAATSPGPASAAKIKRIPILLQSEPEGADIYVSGKLESLGVTPKWVNLDIDPQSTTRVMFRKNGFQDKAVAIESERPPMVHLIPTKGEASPESAADKAAAAARARAHAAAAAWRRRKAGESAPAAPEDKPPTDSDRP